MERASRLLFTPGDPAGIGPEVILKAVAGLTGDGPGSATLIGPRQLWEMAAARLGLSPPESLGVEIVAPDQAASKEPLPEESLEEVLFAGRSTARGACLALDCLETAALMLESDPQSTAVVTGPVNKQGLHDVGQKVPGHTEWFANRFGVTTPVMMLVGGDLRVALLSTHLPLNRVAGALTRAGIVERIGILAEGLRGRFGINEPTIALLALNPHGGVDGEPGTEEREILEPALLTAGESGIDISGPFSADAFFGRRRWEDFDAVLASYHDQGLIPVKMEAAGAGANVTLGLPVVRTSPDHGTAYDIAGSGAASPDAMVAAARLALRLLEGRAAR